MISEINKESVGKGERETDEETKKISKSVIHLLPLFPSLTSLSLSWITLNVFMSPGC